MESFAGELLLFGGGAKVGRINRCLTCVLVSSHVMPTYGDLLTRVR